MPVAGQPVAVLLVGAAGSHVGRSIARTLADRGVPATEAANVYDAVVTLAQRRGAMGLALIGVDALDDAEMEVFGFLHRRWPQVKLVAFGEATSGRRLAAAAAAGAISIIAAPVINGQLDDLLGLPGAAAAAAGVAWERVSGAEKASDPQAARGPVCRPRSVGVSDTLSGSDTATPAASASPAPVQAPPPLPADRPAPRAELQHRDVLTDAEMNALLGDGSDVPVASRPDLEFPEEAEQDADAEDQVDQADRTDEPPSDDRPDRAEQPDVAPRRRRRRRPSGGTGGKKT
jgi:hypothetical protein